MIPLRKPTIEGTPSGHTPTNFDHGKPKLVNTFGTSLKMSSPVVVSFSGYKLVLSSNAMENYSKPAISLFPKVVQVDPKGSTGDSTGVYVGRNKKWGSQLFEDIVSMEIPSWIINPFDETEVENVILQEELFELSTNEELKVIFKTSYVPRHHVPASTSTNVTPQKRTHTGRVVKLPHILLAIFALVHSNTLKKFLVTIGNFDTQYREFGFGGFGQIEIKKSIKSLEFAKLIYDRINVLTARTGQIIRESYYMTPVEEETDTISNYTFNVKRMENAYKVIVDASALLEKSVKWQDGWWAACLCIVCEETASICLQIMLGVVYDQIHAKEEELKTTLANHLCCSSLDKEGRILAREFLAKLDTKSLSFKLLGIVDVGVRLPVQCLSLTLTCLIILLQFGKLVENLMWAK
ncbi:hypothetical protein EVAR_17187_1 [Eumeta japonica]|uniref:Uncharacterized protein n=1 Tax=Eumeta variegata TaxID=151549 RepID=A0A4C1U8S4_EUMVA|nr:hypothetical protein EVAR_17187_1 [Eumeta japonica]